MSWINDVVGLLTSGESQSGKIFDHYRYGEEEDYTYPSSYLRGMKTIGSGEKENQDRLLSSLTKQGTLRKTKRPAIKDNLLDRYSLKDIKDREEFYLDDYYDLDFNDKRKTDESDTDLKYSLGSFKLNSKSNLKFYRMGNKLLPYGDVEHSVSDLYDFNGNNYPLGTFGKALEKMGKGKPYKVYSSWRTYPMGVIDIKDDTVDASNIEWNFLK